ncbi:hypothetical protein BGX38DRAFT_1087783 [Terfezia claveryi]|nr:hypothetical protein BGX38DRAFT_1087783 [Terfezia claveryi]
MKYLTFLSLVLSSLTIVSAHTWVDNIKVTGGAGPIDGSLGFIRGYIGHSDVASSYRIDKPQQSVYKDNQRQPTQPDPKFRRLKASPGSEITAEWHENGHTTNDTPENNAPGYNSGKVFMYGTTQPSPDLTLEQIWKWKGDGTLEGRYLGTFLYDDGMCAEEGSQGRPGAIPRWAAGGGGPCKGKFNLPQDLPPGKPYTVYWVWDFSGKVPGGQHFEWYTSVMDIDIVGKVSKRKDIPPGVALRSTQEAEDYGAEALNKKDDDKDEGMVGKRTVDDESAEDDANDYGDDDTVGKVGKRDDESIEDDANDVHDDDIARKVYKHTDDDESAEDDDIVEQPPLIKRSAKFRAAW